MKVIWNGVQFLQVTNEEAEKLVAEGKAQEMADGFTKDGKPLMHRRDFQGYKTREMRAEAPVSPEPPAPPEPSPVQDEQDEELEVTEEVDLEGMTVKELRKLADSMGLEGYTALKKADLIEFIAEQA